MLENLDLMRLCAICADSFITSPSFPVSFSFPSPGVSAASMYSMSPPTGVHASPVTTPAGFLSGTSS